MDVAIVFGDGHYNTLGLVRSLGERGLRVVLFSIGCRGTLAEHSRYIGEIYHCANVDSAVVVMKEKFTTANGRIPVLCGNDTIMYKLDAHHDELKDRFCIFNVGDKAGSLQHYQDKQNTFDAAEKSGFKKIGTWTIVGGQEIPPDVIYPCLIKGANSVLSTKADMRVCQNRVEVINFIRSGVQYLVQEYIEKDCEIDACGLAWNQGQEMYMPAVVLKIRDDLRRQSAYGALVGIDEFPKLYTAMFSELVRQLKFEGLFSVEILKRGSDYYFLEINLRNDGCGYMYTAAGANYPYLWCLYAKNELTAEVIDKLCVKLPFRMMQLCDIRNLQSGEVSFGRWLVEALTADVHFVWNLRDMHPFVSAMRDRMRSRQ